MDMPITSQFLSASEMAFQVIVQNLPSLMASPPPLLIDTIKSMVISDILVEIKRDMDAEMYKAAEYVEEKEAIVQVIADHTGSKGVYNQQIHCDLIVIV